MSLVMSAHPAEDSVVQAFRHQRVSRRRRDKGRIQETGAQTASRRQRCSGCHAAVCGAQQCIWCGLVLSLHSPLCLLSMESFANHASVLSGAECKSALCAADVLSDPKSRALYDEYGLEGMQHMSGAAAGRGNARQVP